MQYGAADAAMQYGGADAAMRYGAAEGAPCFLSLSVHVKCDDVSTAAAKRTLGFGRMTCFFVASQPSLSATGGIPDSHCA